VHAATDLLAQVSQARVSQARAQWARWRKPSATSATSTACRNHSS